MARLEAPVMNTRRCALAARASSNAYWISGLSTTVRPYFGLALVAGRKRVPRPATGNTAVRMADLKVVLIGIPSRGPYGSLLGALGPLEDRRPHAVPGAAFRAAPVPANAVEAAIIALVAAAGVADAGQQRTERARLGSRLHARAELRGDARKRGHIRGRHRRGEQPCQLPRGDLTALSQPTAQLIQHIHAPGLARDGENRGNEREREARRHLQGMQVQQQCAASVARPLADPRAATPSDECGPGAAACARARCRPAPARIRRARTGSEPQSGRARAARRGAARETP